MSPFSEELIGRSGYAAEGFAEGYERNRPRPPTALLDVLCRLARVERPSLVVDLGAGTGLSARAWAERADDVVGVEPNPTMLRQAGAATQAANVRYVEAFAHATGLEEGRADLVTCSQSLHWMEPEPVLAEAARLLRPGGVFAAYDYDWPPVVDPEVDAAFMALRAALKARRPMGAATWPKAGHLERIEASGRFRFTRELVLHSLEEGDAERIVGFALSLGPIRTLEEDEPVGLEALRETARRIVGDERRTLLFGYRVRVGVR